MLQLQKTFRPQNGNSITYEILSVTYAFITWTKCIMQYISGVSSSRNEVRVMIMSLCGRNAQSNHEICFLTCYNKFRVKKWIMCLQNAWQNHEKSFVTCYNTFHESAVYKMNYVTKCIIESQNKFRHLMNQDFQLEVGIFSMTSRWHSSVFRGHDAGQFVCSLDGRRCDAAWFRVGCVCFVTRKSFCPRNIPCYIHIHTTESFPHPFNIKKWKLYYIFI